MSAGEQIFVMSSEKREKITYERRVKEGALGICKVIEKRSHLKGKGSSCRLPGFEY